MSTESKSETPRTDALCESRHEPLCGLVWADDARQLEKELIEANKRRMEDCATSLEQSSLVIKVTKERDELKEERNNLAKQLEGMINGQEQDQKYIEELAKENKAMRGALKCLIDWKGLSTTEQNESDLLDRAVSKAIHALDLLNTTNLILLTRTELIAEIEKMPCSCLRTKNSFKRVGYFVKCERCKWRDEVKGGA